MNLLKLAKTDEVYGEKGEAKCSPFFLWPKVGNLAYIIFNIDRRY